MKEIELTPNYENTIKWFADGLSTHSFNQGALLPVISLIEQVRYLYQTEPQALERALDYLRKLEERRNPQVVLKGITVISAEGTTTGDLMSDDSIRLVPSHFLNDLPGGMALFRCNNDHQDFGSIEFEAPYDWQGTCEYHNADGSFDREAYLETKRPLRDDHVAHDEGDARTKW